MPFPLSSCPFLSFHEERSLLREQRLEPGEVQHDLVRIHLAKVRVDGGVHEQARGHPQLEVHADVG